MDFFKKSAKIRLKSYHSKYLYAEEDEVTAWQSKNGSIRNAEWEVEFDGDDAAVVKLKSCYGCYLSASDVPFLLGMTGQKVMQMKLIHSDLDSSKIRWKPEKEGFGVKLRSTGAGSYLRANGGLPPWRDSVTHDVQHHISQDCIWYVEPVAPATANHAVPPSTNPAHDLGDPDLPHGSTSAHRPQLSSIPSCSSFTKNLFPIDDSVATTPPSPDDQDTHPPKPEGRLIRYTIIEDDGDDEIPEDFSSEFVFEGHDLKALKQMFKRITGAEDDVHIILKNHITNKWFPLALQLPPSNQPMSVVVVKSSSKLAKILAKQQSGASYKRADSLDYD